MGDAGNDVLYGGSEGDQLWGGTGNDFLYGGSMGDTFTFPSLAESKRGAARDVIGDFSHADTDLIDLAGIDAKKGGGGNAFHFIGKQHFHDRAGELHYLTKTGSLIVEGDVNGDGRADFQIEVHGVTTLTAGDFLL
jgi:Ca2+-binding RTX toxin-like protein